MIRMMLIASTALSLAACKIVAKSDDPDDVPQDDDARMAALVETDWDARILPRLRESAMPLPEVLNAMETDFPAARETFGGGAAEGTPGNFVVRGDGLVVAADLESRAARLEVDVTGDGAGDVELQLGPVIRGTALRDSLPFYEFTAFRDQIEFAKLARALNDTAHAAMPEAPTDPVGQTVSFVGVFAMTDEDDAREIVPLDLTWGVP